MLTTGIYLVEIGADTTKGEGKNRVSGK